MIRFIFFSCCLVLLISGTLQTSPETTGKEYVPYLPGTRLFYQSSFGAIKTEITSRGNMLYIRNDGEKFKYDQDYFQTHSGLRLNRVYQKLKVMSFITKEQTSTYKTPMLRYQSPCPAGKIWNAKSVEYVKDDSLETVMSIVESKEESVTVKAGTFSALKITTIFSHVGGDQSKVIDWIVPGIGIVKSIIYISGDGLMGVVRSMLGYSQISFELQKWEKM
jgi:hypothetical protein